MTEASRALHSALDGEAYLDQVTIEVPHTWTEMDCKTPLSPACLSPSARKVSVRSPDNSKSSYRPSTLHPCLSLKPQISEMKGTKINCKTVFICHPESIGPFLEGILVIFYAIRNHNYLPSVRTYTEISSCYLSHLEYLPFQHEAPPAPMLPWYDIDLITFRRATFWWPGTIPCTAPSPGPSSLWAADTRESSSTSPTPSWPPPTRHSSAR